MHAFAVLLLVLATSCAVELPEQEVSDVESGIYTSNKLTSNKLTSNKLTSNSLATVALAQGSLESNAMLDTADRRDVLSYIVSCALPAGEVLALTEDQSGVTYEFHGEIGLAPSWATGAPTITERRWVTACVLARTNLYGIEVPISMRHDTHPALTPSYGEAIVFDVAEGAFYGDLFESSPVMYACGAKSWTQPTPQTPRACALSQDGITTDCGFIYTGMCHRQPCSDHSAPFSPCTGGASTYGEVITVFLEN